MSPLLSVSLENRFKIIDHVLFTPQSHNEAYESPGEAAQPLQSWELYNAYGLLLTNRQLHKETQAQMNLAKNQAICCEIEYPVYMKDYEEFIQAGRLYFGKRPTSNQPRQPRQWDSGGYAYIIDDKSFLSFRKVRPSRTLISWRLKNGNMDTLGVKLLLQLHLTERHDPTKYRCNLNAVQLRGKTKFLFASSRKI